MILFQTPLGASAWLLSEATMERLGWVLLHSLWQFLLTAILALFVLRFMKRASASSRYAFLVFAMAICVVSPVATWFSQPTNTAPVAIEDFKDAISPLPLGGNDEVAMVDEDHGLAAELPSISIQPSAESSSSMTEKGEWLLNTQDRLRPWLMSIVTAWILGVMICAMRPLLSWIAIRRWRRVGTTPVGKEVTELMLRLCDKFAVGRSVEILQSTLVRGPLVFGCFRPLILLPASLLTNLPTSQLEAIIAHELAHVRRHDFLVNFMQTIIETLFFYHPAIWWLSHRIRIERENCCDDLVVSALCNRVDYGRALLAVEENLGVESTLALGASDGSLLARVQRLAGLEAARRRPVSSVAAMITSGLLVAGTAFMISSLLFAGGDDNEALFGNASNGLQIRLVPLTPEVSDESPELQKIASSFKRSQEMTFAVQLKNVSSQPISLAGIRYGDGYAPETQGKLNTAMLAPHWFEFEFTGIDGKRILRTPHREFYQQWSVADNSSVHVLAPGESLIEVLRPAKFMQPMDYDLLPGKYRAQVHYRGPNDSLRDNVRKHWPDKPILNAWPHQATSNVSDFSIEEASNRTKPEELIWGKPVEGLQAALEYRLPDDAKGNPLVAPGVAVGSRLGITFHLRNVSDKPITFVSETGRQGDNVHVTDDSGKEVEVKSAFFTGWPIDVAWKLMPGEVAQLSLLTPGLGSLEKPGKYEVRYTIRFNSRSQKDEAGNIIFPRPGDYDKEIDTGETPLFLHEPKNNLSAKGEIQPEEPILDGSFRDEVNLKLTRKDAHQGKWYFVDLDYGKLKTPPFDVEIDATRFPYFVTKPSEEELSDWLKRDGVDLILRSSIYRPDPKGPIERNEIQVRSVRTLLKELPRGLEKETTNSPTWKQTLEEDVPDAFGAKDDAVHVVGFIPNATAVDIRPDSPFLRSFRTASNLLGVFLLEQPSSNDYELNFRIAYAANKDTPLDDLRFGPDDFVSGLELLEQPVVRKSSEAAFIAKFPNDIRVEFVGLSRGVGDIKAADKWWRPDGSPLEQAPEHRGASGVLKEGELESEDPFVRTVIHVHGIGDSNAVTATSSIQTAESLKDKSGGLYVAHHGYADAPGRSRTFEVGVATEAPSPKRWLDRVGKRIESKTESVKDTVVEDITIEKVGPESWGKGATSRGGMTDPVGPGDQKMGSLSGTTQVTIRFPLAWRAVDLRLFAIDKSGNSHAADFTIALDPSDENADYKRLAKVIPIDYSEVDHFEYQFRVYRHWAIFENVSLWKGTQTEVAMKSETISKTSLAAASADNSTAISHETQPAKTMVAKDTASNARTVANRGTLRGRFVFDGVPPPSKDYFGDQVTIDGAKPQQSGSGGRMSGVEAFYREFLAKGERPDTKVQTLLVGNNSGVANIYIWASSKNIPWEAPAGGMAPVNVEFRDGKLTNRCFNVVTGQKLQFENRDPVDHSLAANFMKARNTSFNLFVKAKSKYEGNWSFPVAEPFPTRLDLGRAPWASGVLFVHSNPYVAITRSDGSFEIENLPIGEWEFQVWHETAGYLLPNRAAFKHTIVEGENNLGTKHLKPEVFGIRESAKAAPITPENREQIGTVQGKPVYRDEIVNGNLLELFTNPIWAKYKQEHREAIEPTEKELESARSYFSQQHRSRLEKEGGESKLREELKAIEDKLSNSKLSEEEANKLELEHSGLRSRLRPIAPGFANFILDNWKLQKHLYENFGGGRILWQQAGQEAFDAMRTWLELQEKNGEFQITDPKIRVQFYQYWNQDHGAFLTSDEKRIREEFLQPPWAAVIPVAVGPAPDDPRQKDPSSTNANTDFEKTVLGILRTPFNDDWSKGTWQLGAHDIEVHSKLRALPQRADVIKTLLKVIDRTEPSSMHERRLAMGFLGGSDPKNLVPRLNKEIEIAIANPAKPFAAYHEIEMLGRLGENARSSLPLLIKLLDSTDGVAYNLALESLTKIGARSPDVMSELAKHTDDPLTVYQLGRYGQMAKSYGPLFVGLLDSPSHEIHTWSAHALVKTGFDETRGFRVLMADVAAGKSEDRCRAATALAALGSQATALIPNLRAYENDPDPQVAKEVRDAIVRIEKDDRIFTHAEEATKREKALEASAALNPQMQFNLRIVGGEEHIPIAGIEIIATNGYGDSQKKFGPFLTDASGETLCKLPQGSYTLHLNSKNELPYLPYEKFWKELPPPGFKWLNLRVTGIGVEKWLGGEIRENGVEHAKSSQELTHITFTLLKPVELILRAVDKDTGQGLPGAYFYLESAVAEDWAHPIDGANLGAAHYRDGEHAFDSGKYQTDADGYFKRFISDGYLRRSGDSEWGPKFGVWKSPEGYEVVEPSGEVAIDFPADNRSSVEQVFHFRRVK